MPILLSTGLEGPPDWLATQAFVLAAVAVILVGLWLAMVVAVFRRSR